MPQNFFERKGLLNQYSTHFTCPNANGYLCVHMAVMLDIIQSSLKLELFLFIERAAEMYIIRFSVTNITQ